MPANSVVLTWFKFSSCTAARAQFRHDCCVYIQADKDKRPIRVGKASKGLDARYHGGTGYALDAAMHSSGNLFYVAKICAADCAAVECELIWQMRVELIYNNFGKRIAPAMRIALVHEGEPPLFPGLAHMSG